MSPRPKRRLLPRLVLLLVLGAIVNVSVAWFPEWFLPARQYDQQFMISLQDRARDGLGQEWLAADSRLSQWPLGAFRSFGSDVIIVEKEGRVFGSGPWQPMPERTYWHRDGFPFRSLSGCQSRHQYWSTNRTN